MGSTSLNSQTDCELAASYAEPEEQLVILQPVVRKNSILNSGGAGFRNYGMITVC